MWFSPINGNPTKSYPQILVHSWAPRNGISRPFHLERLWHSEARGSLLALEPVAAMESDRKERGWDTIGILLGYY